MKLRELKEDASRNEAILARAKKNFVNTLVADLSKALANSSLSSTTQQTTAQATTPETPEQKRLRLTRAAQQTADNTGATFSKLPAQQLETPEQKRIRLQQARIQAARTSMTPKTATVITSEPKFKAPKINGLQPRNMGESENFKRLNKIFENMIMVDENIPTLQLSPSDTITTNFINLMNAPYIFSTKNSETLAKIKEYADKIVQTYNSPDKGKTAMEELGNWAWETMDEAKRKRSATKWGTNLNPQAATTPQQLVPQPTGPTINADGSITIAGAKGEQPGKVLPGDPMYKQLAATINNQLPK